MKSSFSKLNVVNSKYLNGRTRILRKKDHSKEMTNDTWHLQHKQASENTKDMLHSYDFLHHRNIFCAINKKLCDNILTRKIHHFVRLQIVLLRSHSILTRLGDDSISSSSWSVMSSGSRLLSVVVVVIWLELSSMTGSDGFGIVSAFSASAFRTDGFESDNRTCILQFEPMNS